jgi:hypothetical protein
MKRRRFKQTVSLEERLAEEARRLREEAELLPTDLCATPRSGRPGKLRPART